MAEHEDDHEDDKHVVSQSKVDNQEQLEKVSSPTNIDANYCDEHLCIKVNKNDAVQNNNELNEWNIPPTALKDVVRNSNHNEYMHWHYWLGHLHFRKNETHCKLRSLTKKIYEVQRAMQV